MRSILRRLGVLVLPALLAASASSAQDSAPSYQQPRGNRMPPVPKADFQKLPVRFSFSADATALLHRLWAESAANQREHVACIMGEVQEDKVKVTRVLLLDVAGADSLGVSAQSSIDACGPPDWLGTVHTHIARYDGQHPYPNFSGADRGIMLMWWQRWQVDGLFCVLYSESEAFCEVSGVSGLSHMSRGPY
jgi:hypothetical protein